MILKAVIFLQSKLHASADRNIDLPIGGPVQLKPHQNIFFYYAGTAKSADGKDRQLEDNTTKAFINLLEITAKSDPKRMLLRRFLSWVGASDQDLQTVRFALQKSSISESVITGSKQTILLGIAPRVGDHDVTIESGDHGSRPDAWIWSKDFVVCIENKVVGTFSSAQLGAHLKKLGKNPTRTLRDWRSVYGFLAGEMEWFVREKQDPVTRLLLAQFVEYLRIIAYRQEIDMGEFDGFRPEHFSAFTFLDDDEAEDNRRQVKHYLGQFLDEVRSSLPEELEGFKCQHLGNIKAKDRAAWGTLSTTEKMVSEPHFSFMIDGSSFSLRLLIEGTTPARKALRNIREDPGQFLSLISELKDFDMLLNRRWQKHAQQFGQKRECSIKLDRVEMVDVDYLIRKMEALEKAGYEKGYFMLMIDRAYSYDAIEIRDKGFAKTVAMDLASLIPLLKFLRGDC